MEQVHCLLQLPSLMDAMHKQILIVEIADVGPRDAVWAGDWRCQSVLQLPGAETHVKSLDITCPHFDGEHPKKSPPEGAHAWVRKELDLKKICLCVYICM